MEQFVVILRFRPFRVKSAVPLIPDKRMGTTEDEASRTKLVSTTYVYHHYTG